MVSAQMVQKHIASSVVFIELKTYSAMISVLAKFQKVNI